MKKIIALFILIVFMAFPVAVGATGNEEPAVDVIFIMDLSGSMNSSDREKVSLTSVSIFADYLGDSSSQIGYVLFSDDVIQSMPLTPVEQAKSRIRNNLLTREFGGYTNVPAGLDSALNLFKQSNSSNQKVAILFTDGNVELPRGSGLTNQQGEEKCRETAQAFKEAGIPLYTVGLNYDGNLNINFIQALSELSSSPGVAAKSYEAKTNWDIPEIFSKIYINVFNGNADVDLRFNSQERLQTAAFRADEGIYELNVLLIHKSGLENLSIKQPNGLSYQGASFQQRDGYSFVKIRYPAVGDWEFSFQGDFISANKLVRYVTTTTNITVTFNTDGGGELDAIEVSPGRPLQDIPKPTRSGFSFDGWYLNEARTQRLNDGHTFSRDTLLYAKWIPQIMRSISFVGDGFETEVHKMPDGDRFYNHLPNAPIRKGYVFIGWYIDTETELDTNALISQDLTLTAHWDKISVNLIPSILFFILAAGIFFGGWFVFSKKYFNDSNELSARFCAGIAALFALFFSLAGWAFLKAYIIPVEILSSAPARDSVGSFTFAKSMDLFALFGGLIAPFILNLLLAAVLPLFFVSPAARFGKEKQYLVHLIITATGLIWPSILWVLHGAGASMFWVFGYSLILYSGGFFLSAWLFRQGNSQTCNRFFFDL